jgi:hypothetical protein
MTEFTSILHLQASQEERKQNMKREEGNTNKLQTEDNKKINETIKKIDAGKRQFPQWSKKTINNIVCINLLSCLEKKSQSRDFEGATQTYACNLL